MSLSQMSHTGAGSGSVGAAEYAALQEGAVVLPHDAVWKSFAGPKAVDVLNGLVTQDVSALQAGEAGIAVALTPKGKVVADLLIVQAAPERFLVGASAASASAWHDLVRKYVNPRLATVNDEAGRLRSTLVAGPRAAEVATAARLATSTGTEATETVVARIALQTPTPFWLVVAPLEEGVRVADALASAGATAGSDTLALLARVEAGWPSIGCGMDENTIPQEANLDVLGAISFTKGCYTGQETVARVHFRGHVNRHLRGLRSERPLATGAAIVDTAGKTVGDVRVVAHSPGHGSIALAMVRREIGEGASVLVQVEGADVPATVVVLPFR